MAEITAKKDSLITKLDKVLAPIGQKLGNEKHLQAISNGMLFGLPFLVIGSFFSVVANPPIVLDRYNPRAANIFMQWLAGWKYWAVTRYTQIAIPYNIAMGVFGMICAFDIVYKLSKPYRRFHPAINRMISLVTFSIVVTTVDKNNRISLDNLGTDGLFVAIIIGLLAIEIDHRIEKSELKVELPASIPPMVANFVNSLIPLLANIFIFCGANLVLVSITYTDFTTFIMKCLTLATFLANSSWGCTLIITLGDLLWLIGVNGSNIVFPIVFATGIAATGTNAALVARGLAPTHLINLQMFRIAVLGGSGNSLALVISVMKSKVEKYRTLGKLSVTPGIRSINKSIIFGAPICFNPILGTPFLIAPIINIILTYVAEGLHWIGMGYVVDPSFTPFFFQTYMSSMDWRNIIFEVILIIIGISVYLPFFGVTEQSELRKQEVTE